MEITNALTSDRVRQASGQNAGPRPLTDTDQHAEHVQRSSEALGVKPVVPPRPPDKEQALRLEKLLNEYLESSSRDLKFHVDDGSGRIILKVIHSESGEVIRQIPAEELLQFAKAYTDGVASLMDDDA